MEITMTKEENVIIFNLDGSLDAISAPQLDEVINKAFAENIPKKCIFLMQNVDYISSAGLRCILGAAKALRKKQGQLLFVGLVPSVLEVFELSGFTAYFKDFESLELALAH